MTNFLLLAQATGATNSGVSGAPGINLTIQGVFGILQSLTCWAIQIALLVIVIAIIWYGLQFIMARGNPGAIDKAKTSLLWGIVGIIVILGAYTIIATIGNAINPGQGWTSYFPIGTTCANVGSTATTSSYPGSVGGPPGAPLPVQ